MIDRINRARTALRDRRREKRVEIEHVRIAFEALRGEKLRIVMLSQLLDDTRKLDARKFDVLERLVNAPWHGVELDRSGSRHATQLVKLDYAIKIMPGVYTASDDLLEALAYAGDAEPKPDETPVELEPDEPTLEQNGVDGVSKKLAPAMGYATTMEYAREIGLTTNDLIVPHELYVAVRDVAGEIIGVDKDGHWHARDARGVIRYFKADGAEIGRSGTVWR